MTLPGAVREAIGAALELLETDPYADYGGREWVNTVPHQALRDAGYRNVRRLKAWNLRDHRVFYVVDDPHSTVLVKEIVAKKADTYDLEAPHVKRIKKNWRRYFHGETEQ